MPCGLASLGGEPLRRLLHCWVVSACVWLSGAAFAQAADTGCRLQIITSYPESFYRPFVERFSSDYGRACVTNKNTIALMRHMREGRRPVADVVWTSSPVAFAALDADGLLDHRPRHGRGGPAFRRARERASCRTRWASPRARPAQPVMDLPACRTWFPVPLQNGSGPPPDHRATS